MGLRLDCAPLVQRIRDITSLERRGLRPAVGRDPFEPHSPSWPSSTAPHTCCLRSAVHSLSSTSTAAMMTVSSGPRASAQSRCLRFPVLLLLLFCLAHLCSAATPNTASTASTATATVEPLSRSPRAVPPEPRASLEGIVKLVPLQPVTPATSASAAGAAPVFPTRIPTDTRVLLDGGRYSTLVRLDGTFAFFDLPAGTYRLDVNMVQLVFDSVSPPVSVCLRFCSAALLLWTCAFPLVLPRSHLPPPICLALPTCVIVADLCDD